MKVSVEFLSLPVITQSLGKKKIEIDLKGSLFSELISELSRRIKPFKETALDTNGRVSREIQVYINGEAGTRRDHIDKRSIKDGDIVTFAFVISGG